MMCRWKQKKMETKLIEERETVHDKQSQAWSSWKLFWRTNEERRTQKIPKSGAGVPFHFFTLQGTDIVIVGLVAAHAAATETKFERQFDKDQQLSKTEERKHNRRIGSKSADWCGCLLC